METNTSIPISGNGSATTAGTSSAYTEQKRTATAPRSAASLRADLSNLKNDLDSLVNRAASMSDEELSKAHTQMMAKFSSVRYAARGMASEANRQLNRSVETTTEYVKEKPMQSVAVAAGAGLLLGMLFKRR